MRSESTQGVRTVAVSEDRDGQRLDNFLLGQLKGVPRSLVYKLVRSGQVRVNGKRAKADSRLDAGDAVRIPPVLIEPTAERGPVPRGLLDKLAASIVFEDRWLLVLNKPSGLAAHGGSGISFGVIEAMRALRPEESLDLVHRLDRDTSGLLILAKKRSALTQLQALMREDSLDHSTESLQSSPRRTPGYLLITGQRCKMDDRQSLLRSASGVHRDDDQNLEMAVTGGIRKRYLCLLVGRLPDGVMTVDAALDIGLRQGGERHVRVASGGSGKPSVSHFRAIERRGGHTFSEVRIETGRTHQIRVHAAHISHPIVGDDKYGDAQVNKRLRDQIGLKRLFLHAAAMEFSLDGGERPYVLNAPLPPELVEALARLA